VTDRIARCPHDAPWFACRECATDRPPDPDPSPVTGTTKAGWIPLLLVIALAVTVIVWRLTQ
jgi:hypothetical protein